MMDAWVTMVVDLDRCWGCRACEVACKQELAVGTGPKPMKVLDTGARILGGQLQRDFIPTMCQHCDEPRCQQVCPADAIVRAADGTIQIEEGACIGCGACVESCPFGVVEERREGETPVKCTLCAERRGTGSCPSCAQHCIGRVMTVVSGDQLPEVIGGRHHWRTGRIVYVSGKWESLGEGMA